MWRVSWDKKERYYISAPEPRLVAPTYKGFLLVSSSIFRARTGNQFENFVPIRVKSYLLMYLSVFGKTYNSFRTHYA
jgi:hypothetical protein